MTKKDILNYPLMAVIFSICPLVLSIFIFAFWSSVTRYIYIKFIASSWLSDHFIMRFPFGVSFQPEGLRLEFVVGQVCQEKLNFCFSGNFLISPLSQRDNFFRNWIFHWQFFFLSTCISYLTAFWSLCFQIGYQMLIFLGAHVYDELLLITFKFPLSALALTVWLWCI